MTQNRQEALLNALKLQLQFCEEGVYQTLRGRLPARASENDPMTMPLFEERKRDSKGGVSGFAIRNARVSALPFRRVADNSQSH